MTTTDAAFPVTPALFDLTGRKALVTGGASGIGAAIALALAGCGCTVAITTNRNHGAALADTFATAGRQLHRFSADLGALDQHAVESLVDDVEAELGGLDILVNNAGIIERAPAAEHPRAAWDDVLALNLSLPFILSQSVGRRMLARGRGKIIMTASMLSFQGGVNVPGYAASKHAIAGLTKALANEWAGRGINVNAIAPGYIETSATEALRDDAKRSADILGRIPAGRWGHSSDIGGAAVFLASDAADYIHGHILAVDGGWLAR